MKHYFFFLTFLFCVGCINEPLEIDAVAQGDLIEESSELFQFLAQITEDESEPTSVTCIDFVYPFIVYQYDEFDEYVSATRVGNDYQFWQFLLGIPEENSVGISFPIQATLEDGTLFEINSADQLAQSIQGCIQEIQQEVLGGVSEAFQQCGWEVRAPEGVDPDQFEYSVFEVTPSGGVVFYDAGVGSPGTWIFYFIANQLHMNINLDGVNETIDETWNKDWIVTGFTENNLQITRDDITYELNKICEPEIYCTTLFFEECAIIDGDPTPPYTANFIFENYSRCIGLITEKPQEDGYSFAYFEAEADAEANVNALPQDGYLNIENAQTIYVRITDPTDVEFELVEITILASLCE